MSYRLIDANDLNGKISDKDYEIVLNVPCIYADLPKGLDGRYYGLTKREKKQEWKTNGDAIKAIFPRAKVFNEDSCCVTIKTEYKNKKGEPYVEYTDFDSEWWNSPYKADKE